MWYLLHCAKVTNLKVGPGALMEFKLDRQTTVINCPGGNSHSKGQTLWSPIQSRKNGSPRVTSHLCWALSPNTALPKDWAPKSSWISQDKVGNPTSDSSSGLLNKTSRAYSSGWSSHVPCKPHTGIDTQHQVFSTSKPHTGIDSMKPSARLSVLAWDHMVASVSPSC